MRILITLGLFLLVAGLHAQKLDHRLGYLMVQTRPGFEAADIVKIHSSRFRSDIRVDKTISKRLDIHLIAFDHARIHEGQLLQAIRSDRGVSVAQFDHFTSHRAIPNDTLFTDQWQWVNTGQTGGEFNADIDADLAWEVTTGGVTPMGDTIVVAIIDDGINYNHPDIAANVWKNYAEIPDNGQDDDGNGYVDDYYGWDAYNDDPDVLSSGHGLQVAGMIGAVGNNTTGISGINWNVKMMTIVGGSPESSVIASYSYALDHRIRYNETNGEEGAFVVATNSSWGIDFGNPDEAPIWCSFYDLLGEHGILSAAATSNVAYDVDSLLDLPTACPSDFLFSVTSLNDENERRGAWGKNHVDFGAPGSNIFTTRRESDGFYGNSSGTSFASPVTAGMVALLYSAPCSRVAELARQNPANAAKYVRELIFNGVKSIPGLAETTRFGGSLNAANSMALLMTACVECPTPFEISTEVLSDEEVNLSWIMLDTADALNLRFRPIDSTTWDTLHDVSSPFHLSGLKGCTEYIVEFEAICADTSTGFIVGTQFETEGCCELPANIFVTPGESNFYATWDHVLAAEYFLVQWRLQGETEWLEEVTSLDEVTILDLQSCSFYEFRLQTNCDTSETGFSDIITFRTSGCGNCIDLPYCNSGSESTEDEYIDSLIIGPLVNHSGDNGGYAIFESPAVEFSTGESYDVFLKPGFTGNAFTEQVRIWMDFNHDGEFDEEELVLDTVFLADPAGLFSEIDIPDDALTGGTRMRVSMGGFPSVFDQDPCEILSLGEVEDYCIVILREQCLPVDTVIFDAVTKISAFMYWPSAEGAIAYTYRYKEQGTTEVTELATVDTTVNLSGLKECTTYEVEIRTVCLGDTTSYGLPYRFETVCDVAVNEAGSLLSVFDIFPNPATDYTVVRLQSKESGTYTISILNMQGQRFHQKKIYAEANQQTQIEIEELQHFPQGLYLVAIEKDGATEMRKLVKM